MKSDWYLFGARLRTARLGRKLTQEYLGAKIGVSRQQICMLEHGRNGASIESVVAIAKELKCRPEWLLFGVGL